MADLQFTATVRGATGLSNLGEGQQTELVANSRKELIVSQGLPELAGIVQLGDTWQVKLATGLAALTVLPTTVAGISLYNGEPGTGKSYIIDSFGSYEGVVDATQSDITAIFAMMNTTPATIPTPTALTVRSTVGKTYGGRALVVTTLTVTDAGWFAHGPTAAMAPAVAGANWKVNEVVRPGLYIIPPGGMFSVQAVKAAAAAAAQQFFFVRWHEALIKMG